MPPTPNHRRLMNVFGRDCVFAMLNWRGFLGSLDRHKATVTGTLEEVETPNGLTGLRVAVANSFVQFDWTSLAPLTVAPRALFIRAMFPAFTAFHFVVGYGNTAIVDNAYNIGSSAVPQSYGGLAGDADLGGTPVIDSWESYGGSNEGINGGANEVYLNGNNVASGVNGGPGVTTYTDVFILTGSAAGQFCPLGTIIQEVLAFRRFLSNADHLLLHNLTVGNA